MLKAPLNSKISTQEKRTKSQYIIINKKRCKARQKNPRLQVSRQRLSGDLVIHTSHFIGIMVTVLAIGPGHPGPIPREVILKTKKNGNRCLLD